MLHLAWYTNISYENKFETKQNILYNQIKKKVVNKFNKTGL